MYVCKQVSPEWQEDDLFYNYKDNNGRYKLGWNDEVYEENVIIYGNDDYHYSTIKEFDMVMKIGESYDEYELSLKPKSNHCYWNNASEYLNYYLPKSNGKKYSPQEVCKWKKLLEKYSIHWKEEDIMCEALELMTGKKWRPIKMVGCMQREWQYGYASNEVSDKDIEYIEMCYFNTGSEYQFYESEEDYENDNPSTSYYVDSYNSKERLCEHIGCKPNELKVYEFTGYAKIPQYKEV